jgi:hypothetical protein
MDLPVTPVQPRWRRIAWGIAGIPVTFALFALLITIMFPIGGGIWHVMFAYTQEGDLVGARFVFAGYILATVFITGFLCWTRYPLPWQKRAVVAGAVALCAWLPVLLPDRAGPVFVAQGLLLAPLLPITAFAIGAWSERRRITRKRRRETP